MSLSRARSRRKSATSSAAALGAGGAARSTALPTRSAETSGSPTSAIPTAGQGRFALRTCWGPRPLPSGILAPFRFQPM
eukprot:15462756-Alexandrium_andersonii.AAC.1